MPFLDETGVKRLWQNAKAFFSHGIKASTTDTAVNVILTAKKTTTDTSEKKPNLTLIWLLGLFRQLLQQVQA